MESLAKGTHYNICACAWKETNTDTYKEKKYKQKTAEKKIQKKQRHSKKEQTQEIGERRQAARKTRSKPQPYKPVKGRRTLY